MEAEQLSGVTTLYVNNLNERAPLQKLKVALSKVFGRYGQVLDVTAHKNLKMKGQAFVTYESSTACEKALDLLQNQILYKKPMHIAYAKEASDKAKLLRGDAAGVEARKSAKAERSKAEEEAKKKKQTSDAPTLSAFSKAQVKQWKLLPPNNVLLLQNLAPEFLEGNALDEAFKNFSGFQKVRPIVFRHLAFIDFELETTATACLEKMDMDKFGSASLLSYAKK